MAFEDVGSNLTKKMGPFPVWVWGVIIGGAFVAWYWFSQRGVAQTSSEASDDGTVPAPSGDFSTVPVMPPSDGVVDENTNLEWSAQAVIAVTGTGVSLVTAQSAISKYLNGEQLSNAERIIIDNIIAKIGPPPEGVYVPSPVAPGPAESDNTKTTLSGPANRKFGQSAVIRVKVRWENPEGHVGNPTGAVTFVVDDVIRKSRVPVVNGEAVYITTPLKSLDSTKDKRWVVRATFHGTGKAKQSQSNQLVITLS